MSKKRVELLWVVSRGVRRRAEEGCTADSSLHAGGLRYRLQGAEGSLPVSKNEAEIL
jgi:hypothetical protein